MIGVQDLSCKKSVDKNIAVEFSTSHCYLLLLIKISEGRSGSLSTWENMFEISNFYIIPL